MNIYKHLYKFNNNLIIKPIKVCYKYKRPIQLPTNRIIVFQILKTFKEELGADMECTDDMCNNHKHCKPNQFCLSVPYFYNYLKRGHIKKMTKIDIALYL